MMQMIVEISCLVKGMDAVMPDSIKDIPRAASKFVKDCLNELTDRPYVRDLISEDLEQLFIWDSKGPINLIPIATKVRKGVKP